MADEIDIANEQSERWLNQALANIGKGTPRLAPRGTCYYCDTAFDVADPASARKLFCDSDCAKDHEEEQRLLKRR